MANENQQLKLMLGRLGVYNSYENQPMPKVDENIDISSVYNRLNNMGGSAQQSRMIKDKKKTLDRVLKYSYQAATIQKSGDLKQYRALINPDKIKQNYDDKIISTHFETGLKEGDIFEWVGTNSYWLVYLQEMTELAYFRSEIRRCRHKIFWYDNGIKQTAFMYVRGPVETKIDSFIKQGIDFNTPNYSLNIFMSGTIENIKHFQRYAKFHFSVDEQDLCWRVEAADWISTPGILKITAVEYYHQDTENISDRIVPLDDQNLINQSQVAIIGETFIKPKVTYEYSISADINLDWFIPGKYPVKIIENDEIDYHKVYIKWLDNYSGQFELCYGNKNFPESPSYKKTIIVESLF